MKLVSSAVIILYFFGISTFAQTVYQRKANQTDTNCNCLQAFNNMVSKIESNYIAYHVAIKGKRDAEYRQQVKTYQEKAPQTSDDNCILVLQDFIRFFRDGHLFVQQNPPLTDEDVARLTANAEQTGWRTEESVRRYLDKNKKRLDPIEGIWYNNSGQRFGILRDYKPNRRDLIAVLLTDGVEHWQPGQVKAEFK